MFLVFSECAYKQHICQNVSPIWFKFVFLKHLMGQPLHLSLLVYSHLLLLKYPSSQNLLVGKLKGEHLISVYATKNNGTISYPLLRKALKKVL